jgi:hypothetical protein
MKTKHILAVLSTCLVAVSFSPINFFSQAAPPPGFTMFDGKEFQFDVSSPASTWTQAFICPAGRTMKITDAIAAKAGSSGFVDLTSQSIHLRIVRAANSQVIYNSFDKYNYQNEIIRYSFILGPGDIVEYLIYSNYGNPISSLSISGVLN